VVLNVRTKQNLFESPGAGVAKDEDSFDDETLAEEEALDVLTLSVPEGAFGRLDAWLAAQVLDLSRARIQTLIKEGRVTCGGVPV
jgi:RNA-binding protein YlmH